MRMLCSVQVYDDAVADVSGSSSSSNSSSGAAVMQQLDCAGYFVRGLVLLARQKVYTYIRIHAILVHVLIVLYRQLSYMFGHTEYRQ
jgi:hypothetical protein